MLHESCSVRTDPKKAYGVRCTVYSRSFQNRIFDRNGKKKSIEMLNFVAKFCMETQNFVTRNVESVAVKNVVRNVHLDFYQVH